MRLAVVHSSGHSSTYVTIVGAQLSQQPEQVHTTSNTYIYIHATAYYQGTNCFTRSELTTPSEPQRMSLYNLMDTRVVLSLNMPCFSTPRPLLPPATSG